MRRSRSTSENRLRRDAGFGVNGAAGSAIRISAAAAIGPAAEMANAARQSKCDWIAPAVHSDRLLPMPNVEV